MVFPRHEPFPSTDSIPMSDPVPPHARPLARKLRTALGPEVTEGSSIDQEPEFRALLGALRPRRMIEIGTRHGVSAALFAEYAEEVVTIDIALSPDSYREWTRRVWAEAGSAGKISPFLAAGTTGKECNASKAAFLRGQEFDFAFIDGSHITREVIFDFECLKRCGCILFHDYKPEGGEFADCPNERYPGIAAFIDSLTPQAYLIGKKCSQMALWIAEDHPGRRNPEAMAFLESLARPTRSPGAARFDLLRLRVGGAIRRIGRSLGKRMGSG
jgi:predicted O-methyltransferase YrrM